MPHAPLRDAFVLPEGLIYLNGNSLGALPRAVRERMQQVTDAEWGGQLVAAWNTAGWVDLPQRLGDKIGQLIGAAPGQTLVCDSTSVNIFKLLHAALQRHPERQLVLLEDTAFPTDNYIAEGLRGLRSDLVLQRLPAAHIPSALGPEVAAVLLSHVNYRTGARVDLPRLQQAATAKQIPVVWDLAHSAGAFPLQLDAWGVEFAVGCGYKFFNGGPGAPAFAYVAHAAQSRLRPILSGWFGHARPFAFEAHYAPASGIGRLQVGTPPILSMSALDAAIDVLQGCDLADLWQRSCRLFEQMLATLEADPIFAQCTLLTPRRADERGSQLSISHPQAWAICRALAAEGVIGDYREPGILRFGFAPAYVAEADVVTAAERLLRILRERRWDKPEYQHRPKVT